MGVRGLLLAYRVMASVIGVVLIVLICVGVPLEHLTTEGTSQQQFGTDLDLWLGAIHGMALYPAFLIVAAVLSRRAHWSIAFTVVILVAGTIPFLSFVAEHHATKRVRRDYPEVVGPPRMDTAADTADRS